MSQQYTPDPFLELSDRITIKQVDGSTVREKDVPLSTLIERINNKGESTKIVRYDATIVLTGLNAVSQVLSVFPALTAQLIYFAMKVITPITFNNSGASGGEEATIAALEIDNNGTFHRIFNNAATNSGVCWDSWNGDDVPVVTIKSFKNDHTAAEGLITGGSVRVVIEYQTPNELE